MLVRSTLMAIDMASSNGQPSFQLIGTRSRHSFAHSPVISLVVMDGVIPPLVSLSGLEIADGNIFEVGHRLPQTLLKFRRMAWAASFEKIDDIYVEPADHCIAWLWQVAPQCLYHAAQRSSWDADCTVMHLHMHRHVTRQDQAPQCKILLRLFCVKLEGSMPCQRGQQSVNTVTLLVTVPLQTTLDNTACV